MDSVVDFVVEVSVASVRARVGSCVSWWWLGGVIGCGVYCDSTYTLAIHRSIILSLRIGRSSELDSRL